MPASRLVPRVVQAGTLVVLVLAVGTEIVSVTVVGAAAMQYVPVVVIAAGIVAGLRWPCVGLVGIAAAPLLAVLVGREPATALWSMACFAVLLLTVRGASAIVAGGIVAAANVVAVTIEVGTVDVEVDASASIAGFAAIVCAAIGSAVHGNHRYRVEAERRVREAESGRVAAVDRGIARERLRIARDLHDSVGHQIAVVNMRLGAAEVHLPAGADSARADLEAARVGVQAVLRETQEILTVLRVGSDPGPTHGVSGIPDMLSSFRQAGMVIDASVEDVGDALASGASVAAYRIVQEALTNAQKHGEGGASLTIARDEGQDVIIEVVNLCAPSSIPGGGNGIVGMRERAASVDGILDAHSDGSLFWVRVRLPCRPHDESKGVARTRRG